MQGGREYFPVKALAGATFALDESRLTLSITTRAEAFSETVSALPGSASTRPIVPQPGGFLNYSVTASRIGATSTQSGLFDAGFFSRYGVLTTGILAPTLDRTSEWRRLESTYAIDYPEDLTSLRLGDSVSRAGAWGRAVRFGGVQFGTNFGIQPGFIPFPLASVAGQASLPSTVDVFVNNTLVSQRPVPPGPFSIANIPTVTGAGDVRMVVRDLLGREQVVTIPFYGAPSLLRKDVSDYSFELGAVRRDFTVASNHYGTSIASGTYRRGLTDNLTGEVRAEHSDSITGGGGAAALRLADIAVVNSTFASSESTFGAGRLLGYGVERNGRVVSASLQTTVTDPAFRQAGMAPAELPRRRQTVANFGLQLASAGSVSVTYVVQQFRDQPQIEVSTLSYSVPVARMAQLNVTGSRTFGPSGGTAIFTTLAIALGESTSASASVQRSRSSQTGLSEGNETFVVQKSLPLGEGYGYRLQARRHDLLAGVSAQTNAGTYVLEGARQENGDTATRLTASGGVGTIGGYTFLSRNITDSFAVVRAADFADVRVLQDNQVVGRTNADGYAVLPHLRAYDRNPIALEQADLPLDAAMGALKVHAVPYFRSGVLVDFPVRRIRAATFRVLLEDGGDIPSGALARIEGKNVDFPIALEGQAYVEGLEAQDRVHISWKGRECEIDVVYPRVTDLLPDLGSFVCKGVDR